jgi:hypothetical protein
MSGARTVGVRWTTDFHGRVITMRDLLRDLELCEKATPGPWKVDRNPENLATVSAFYLLERHGGAAYIDDCLQINGNADYTGETYDPVFVAAVYDRYNADNATFVAAAREGWPHAIKRALKAEAEVEKLQTELETVRDEVERLRRREETILRWLDDSCCPPRMMGNRCPERSCGQCFREALDREEAREL